MTDDEIKLHLIEVAIKNHSNEDLNAVVKTITDPMFAFFYDEKDVAKIYLVAQMLEDQAILPIKKKVIEAYKLMNPFILKKEQMI